LSYANLLSGKEFLEIGFGGTYLSAAVKIGIDLVFAFSKEAMLLTSFVTYSFNFETLSSRISMLVFNSIHLLH
jgi:hypothetical protein